MGKTWIVRSLNQINFINNMFSSRITKYNPQYRISSGAYQKNDWTSIADIGKTFDGKPLTFEEYIKVEDAYVDAILYFMDFLNADSLILTNLYKHGLASHSGYYTNNMIAAYKSIYQGEKIKKNEIGNITRLRLREDIACRFESKDMFVHFGYDYYMYIGSSKKAPEFLIEKIENSGLFIEEFESPYSEEIG